VDLHAALLPVEVLHSAPSVSLVGLDLVAVGTPAHRTVRDRTGPAEEPCASATAVSSAHSCWCIHPEAVDIAAAAAAQLPRPAAGRSILRRPIAHTALGRIHIRHIAHAGCSPRAAGPAAGVLDCNIVAALAAVAAAGSCRTVVGMPLCLQATTLSRESH
jgi:hypothetical protein